MPGQIDRIMPEEKKFMATNAGTTQIERKREREGERELYRQNSIQEGQQDDTVLLD